MLNLGKARKKLVWEQWIIENILKKLEINFR